MGKKQNNINENNQNDIIQIKSNKMVHFPRVLHLTCKDKNNIDNPIWKNCLHKYMHMYTKCKIKIHDNEDIYRIVQQFDPENIEYIKQIKIGAVLADIFRYLILYLEGGIYSDMDCEPIIPIHKLFKEKHFHGDQNNFVYIYPPGKHLINVACDFYENPCDECKYVSTFNDGVHKYVCLGHKYVRSKTDIIVCYEYDKTWCKNIINNAETKHKWVDNDIGVCQWFIITKPRQELFLDCYRECVNNIKELLKLNKQNDYHFNVINGSGPLFFTKIINKKLENRSLSKKKICFLPSDFFCCGSNESVPFTKNTYVRHKFTGSWLK